MIIYDDFATMQMVVVHGDGSRETFTYEEWGLVRETFEKQMELIRSRTNESES